MADGARAQPLSTHDPHDTVRLSRAWAEVGGDAGRAAVDAINNKFDGVFDDLLPSTKLEVTVSTFVGDNCGESLGASARTAWQNDLAAANPVAVVGPGGSTCLKSVASVDARSSSSHGSDALVMSESSTATSISDRSKYPNLVRLSSSERLVMESLSVVTKHYFWNRIAVVWDAADEHAVQTWPAGADSTVGSRADHLVQPFEVG